MERRAKRAQANAQTFFLSHLCVDALTTTPSHGTPTATGRPEAEANASVASAARCGGAGA
jgi:hypothetical protein